MDTEDKPTQGPVRRPPPAPGSRTAALRKIVRFGVFDADRDGKVSETETAFGLGLSNRILIMLVILVVAVLIATGAITNLEMETPFGSARLGSHPAPAAEQAEE